MSLPSNTRDHNPEIFNKLKKSWGTKIAEQQKMALQRRSALLKNGPEIFQKYSIKKVFLFGSVLEKKCSTDSDIDILLTSLNESDYWKIRAELEKAVGFHVDVYSQSDDPQFIKKIMERGELIYEA